MRRWRSMSRFRRTPEPPTRRTRLVVELLEAREVLAPLVTSPTFAPINPFPQAAEGGSVFISGTPSSGGSFDVFTPLNSTVDAVLTTPLGFLDVDEALASSLGVSVAGDGTPAVQLIGSSSAVSNLLQSGFTYTAFPGFSGDVPVDLLVRDLTDSMVDTGTLNVQVLPVASFVYADWDASTEIRLATAPFAFPSGFLTVSSWFDPDGSETLDLTIDFFADSSQSLSNFVLLAGGVAVSPSGSGGWTISGTDPVAFQSLLDSLVLVPPAGFSGRITLSVSGTLTDSAFFPSDGSTASSSEPVFMSLARLRFFAPAVVLAPPVLGPGGGVPFSLGGQYAVRDPSELPEDQHTLTIRPGVGALTFDPARVPVGLSVGLSGTGLVLSGELADINRFLADPGSITFSPNDPLFQGSVSLTFELQSEPGMSGMDESEGEPSEGGQFVSDYPPPTVAVVVLTVAPPPGPGTPPPGAPGVPLSGIPPQPGGVPAAGGPGALPPPVAPRGPNVFGAPGPAGPQGASEQSGGRAENASERAGEREREGEEGRPGEREGQREDARERPVYLGATGGAPRGPEHHGNGGPRHGPVPPGHNQPILRTDALPLYLGADGRHPLPPVLPLDQSRSATGFSESAGDSLGLVDLIYREAGPPTAQVLAVLVGSEPGAVPEAPAPRPAAAAPVLLAGAEPAAPTEPAPAGEAAPTYYAYAAVAVLAAVTGWQFRGRFAALFRAARRFVRPTHRQPTQGNT